MKNLSVTQRIESQYQRLKEYWRSLKQWFRDTPERAILEAYQAAERIRNIEIEHFGNQKISSASSNYSENVMSYWQVYLDKNLTIIKLRLAEFHLSRIRVDVSNSGVLEKLHFIDEVTEKYIIKYNLNNNSSSVTISQPLTVNRSGVKKESEDIDTPKNPIKSTSSSHKTGVFPGSIGRTINRIKEDFAPTAEEEFIKNYRISRKRTKTTIKFLLILILVPLLTQILSKQFLVTPLLERIRGENVTQIFINSDMEKEALHELQSFKQKLKFEYLLNKAPSISSEAVQKKIKGKAIEISEDFRIKSNSAISNVFADLISLVAFAVVITLSRREIIVVKSFIDNLVYGLSDSAKAFIIILFTDIFVGFHSPHGWEIILEVLAEHLGLPASRKAIFIFIATFPVILDTIFKYWIFRYLSRLSPSALATLKEMDE